MASGVAHRRCHPLVWEAAYDLDDTISDDQPESIMSGTPRPRKWRWLKWLSCTLWVLTIAAFACTLRTAVWYDAPVGHPNVFIGRGAAALSIRPSQARFHIPASDLGWGVGESVAPGLCWQMDVQLSRPFGIVIPLWMPFLLFGISTALLWYRDRRAQALPSGRCPTCGYDLTGNMTATCPECGRHFDARRPGAGL